MLAASESSRSQPSSSPELPFGLSLSENSNVPLFVQNLNDLIAKLLLARQGGRVIDFSRLWTIQMVIDASQAPQDPRAIVYFSTVSSFQGLNLCNSRKMEWTKTKRYVLSDVSERELTNGFQVLSLPYVS